MFILSLSLAKIMGTIIDEGNSDEEEPPGVFI